MRMITRESTAKRQLNEVTADPKDVTGVSLESVSADISAPTKILARNHKLTTKTAQAKLTKHLTFYPTDRNKIQAKKVKTLITRVQLLENEFAKVNSQIEELKKIKQATEVFTNSVCKYIELLENQDGFGVVAVSHLKTTEALLLAFENARQILAIPKASIEEVCNKTAWILQQDIYFDFICSSKILYFINKSLQQTDLLLSEYYLSKYDSAAVNTEQSVNAEGIKEITIKLQMLMEKDLGLMLAKYCAFDFIIHHNNYVEEIIKLWEQLNKLRGKCFESKKSNAYEIYANLISLFPANFGLILAKHISYIQDLFAIGDIWAQSYNLLIPLFSNSAMNNNVADDVLANELLSDDEVQSSLSEMLENLPDYEAPSSSSAYQEKRNKRFHM